MSGAERSCVGCGKKAGKDALFRIALGAEGELVLDRPQRAKGRGAYVCGADCWTVALKRKTVGRAFRGKWKGLGAESVAEGLQSPSNFEIFH